MPVYHLAGENVLLTEQIPELSAFVNRDDDLSYSFHAPVPGRILAHTAIWIGGKQRELEARFAQPGLLLRTIGGSDFYLTPEGMAILRIGYDVPSPNNGVPPHLLTDLDREIVLGPALILSCALRGIWSLHASAGMYKKTAIAFLGESGQGKSTLAKSLAETGWQLMADDILPVSEHLSSLQVWPHFPQLKLPLQAQPGLSLPDQLPLGIICLLLPSDKDDDPAIQLLSPGEAVKILLAHTAGTRLFTPEMLAKHLEFCARAAEWIPAYCLTYPQRLEALPLIKDLLENLC